MSIATPVMPPPSLPTAEAFAAEWLWPLSVDQYHAMIANGILTEDDRAELLDGMLVAKTTKKPPHTVATQLVRAMLEAITPSGWNVRSQEPITLSTSEPEPDAALVRGTVRDFVTRHPVATEVGLVVEVADTSLDRDRGLKLRLYAHANLPVYWIVNLIERQVEVYTNPIASDMGPTYGTRIDYRDAMEIPVEMGGRQIGVIRASDCMA